MNKQNIFNTVILLLVLGLLYHGVQLNSWVVENRERIESVETSPMTKDIKDCMELYLSTQTGFTKDNGEVIHFNDTKQDAFDTCSYNYRKQTWDN